MKDIVAHVGYTVLYMWQGHEGSEGRGANALPASGTANSCDGGALLDSRSAGPMCGDNPVVWLHVCTSGLRPSVIGYALRPLVVHLLNASCF